MMNEAEELTDSRALCCMSRSTHGIHSVLYARAPHRNSEQQRRKEGTGGEAGRNARPWFSRREHPEKLLSEVKHLDGKETTQGQEPWLNTVDDPIKR